METITPIIRIDHTHAGLLAIMVKTATKHTPMHVVDLRVNSERMRADFDTLIEIGATVSGGVSRLALSNADLEARAWFADRVDEAGLTVNDDDAGNLSGILYSKNPEARKTLLIGSHLDSVPNGGRYDSSVGIIAALEIVRIIREAELNLPVHIEIVDFTDQEGCWVSLFGSKCFSGQLDIERLQESVDPATMSAFRAALLRAGIRPTDIHKAARNPRTIAGYIEMHIEQGSRLHDSRSQIGVVTGIIGRSTYDVTFIGEAGHSGTTAPTQRRDAMLGAASFITRAHQFVRNAYNGAVFNCGNIDVEPGAFNVIPKLARLTIECRHPNETILSMLEADLMELARECARENNLAIKAERRTHMPAANMSEKVTGAIKTALKRLNITSTTDLISYAGHDAQIMSTFTPSGMIFIPSVNGISHNPKEYTHWDDIVAGANVLLQTVLTMAYQCRAGSNGSISPSLPAPTTDTTDTDEE